MDPKLKLRIEKILERNPNDPIDELNNKIQMAINEYNNVAKNDFQGLSPQQMYDLLYKDWGENIISIADLYFKAFPELKAKDDEYRSLDICYIVRTFRDILSLFGFIEYENKKIAIGNIRATDLFRKYIEIGKYDA